MTIIKFITIITDKLFDFFYIYIAKFSPLLALIYISLKWSWWWWV